MKEEIKISWNVQGIHYINMVDISRKTWKNGEETIVETDGILWLSKKHIEEGLGHKNLRVSTVKFF